MGETTTRGGAAGGRKRQQCQATKRSRGLRHTLRYSYAQIVGRECISGAKQRWVECRKQTKSCEERR